MHFDESEGLCENCVLVVFIPVTVTATPSTVSTSWQRGFNVITASESLCTSVKHHQDQPQPPTTAVTLPEPKHPPKIIFKFRSMRIFHEKIHKAGGKHTR